MPMPGPLRCILKLSLNCPLQVSLEKNSPLRQCTRRIDGGKGRLKFMVMFNCRCQKSWRHGALLLIVSAILPAMRAATVSALFARGYSVLPEPQRVHLETGDFSLTPEWRLLLGAGVPGASPAVESLQSQLQERFGMTLTGKGDTSPALELTIRAGAVEPGESRDSDKAAIVEQAYQLDLSAARIRIVANTETGLFYGVQTLVQLIKPENRTLQLPKATITDWPALRLRQMYWDDAHHLEKFSDLKRAVREASFFKINGFIIKLDGHFAYSGAQAVVEPQALTPSEFQELTDYGLRHHVQVIPYLDGPAHISFILKHPEYAKLRAFPESNYELCAVNPRAIDLLKSMYDDLLNANKGVQYFYLSTDEPYYVGLADNEQCREASRAKELGGRGKLLAEFVTQTAGYLHARGREVVFWGEYPLKPEDIKTLPPYVINGETYGEKFDRLYKAHGIRQMVYQSTEGEEQLFPHYFLLPPGQLMHRLGENYERVGQARQAIRENAARGDSDLMGLVIAGWADMGLHPETFWLGYATITAAGWHLPGRGPAEAMSAFYPLWYGRSMRNMGRLYQLMSFGAQSWFDSWDVVDSKSRKPIWGNSNQIFSPPKPANDQSIPLPPVPSDTMQYRAGWSRANGQRLRLVEESGPAIDEVRQLLNENLQLSGMHQYDLEVFAAIAQLYKQNLDMFSQLRRIDEAFTKASTAAQQAQPEAAVAAMDEALAEARQMKLARNKVLHDAVGTWYKSWLPRVPEANGRRFLAASDDVKDHLPDRTIDMSYLVYRELLLPMDDWYRRTEAARNHYASLHHLATRSEALSWKETQLPDDSAQKTN